MQAYLYRMCIVQYSTVLRSARRVGLGATSASAASATFL